MSVETAEPFQPGAKVDRSTAPAFAVLRESPKLVLPADKCILSLGPTRLLGQADRQRLAQSAGAILLKRAGRAILLAGQLDEAVSAFLDRVEKLPGGRLQVYLRDLPEPIPVSLRLAPPFNRKLKSFSPPPSDP